MVAGDVARAVTAVSRRPAITQADVARAIRAAQQCSAGAAGVEIRADGSIYVQLTADEIAKDLNLSVLSVCPRVSELKRLGEIQQTGARRKNESGMTATVWRLRPQPSPPIGGK
jgi:hypothetical protein